MSRWALPPLSCGRPRRLGVSPATRLLILLAAATGVPGTHARGQGPEWESGLFSAMQVRNIGPAGMSGRITAVAAVESDPNLVFVGSATGGLWRSGNGGQTWEPLFDDQPVLGIGAVAVFQPDPDIVWVGTGEGNPRNSAGVGRGIYKSTDGGQSWEHLGLEDSERIHRIVLHPSDPSVAYAGVMGPAWSDGAERGVFRTTDGGVSWERVLFVDQRTGVADLVMDPENPGKLFAAMWEFRRWPWFFESGGPGSGLYLTRDAGDTWTRLTPRSGLPEGDLGRIGLAIPRDASWTVYALVEAEAGGLFRSRDGGNSWELVNAGRSVLNRPFYYAELYADPTDEDRLFNLHSRITRSEDGGATFREIGQGVHPDFHAMWIDPGDSRLMYLGSDGGLYVTRDGGERWAFVDNLPLGQFYHVSVDMETPFNVYGGMQDNGSWRGPSDVWGSGGIRNHHWEEVGTGDGFGTLLDPEDPSLGYSMSQAGGLVRFDLRTGERKGIRPWAPDTIPLRFNWNAAIALDPFQPGTLYFGSQFVHRTTNRGETWEIISPDLTSDDPAKQQQSLSGGLTRDVTGAENHTTILTIAPSPAEPELIWVGTDDGRVHLTRSRGGHWSDVGRNIRGVPENTWIPHIEASRHHGGTAYVVMDDHRRGNWTPYILRTDDYGEHWTHLADDNGIQGFVHTVEEDPVTPNLLFAGTEFGLYVSLDRGERWLPWRNGLPGVPVRSLVIHPRDHDLVVGTHGRAIHVLDDIRPLRALAQSPSLSDLPVYLFDPPPAFLRSLSGVDGSRFPGDAVFLGEARPAGALLTYWWKGGDEDVAEIRIEDSAGKVIRTLEGSSRTGMNRLLWDLREDPPGEEGPSPSSPGAPLPGVEVLPGLYDVVVARGGDESRARLEVLPDPRVEISQEDRLRKQSAVRQAQELLLSARAVQGKADEVEAALVSLSETLGGRTDSLAASLGEGVEGIRRNLESVAEVLAASDRTRRDLVGMARTRDAPTEAERIALRRFEAVVEGAITRLNGIIVTSLERLRREAEAGGLGQFPAIRVVIRAGGD